MELHYVIYVGSGKENTAEISIRKIADERKLYSSCFHPVRHMKKKIRGQWIDYYDRLIPGYVFVESENILELYSELRKNPILLKVLGKDMQEDSVIFHALTEGEVDWLRKLMGNFEDGRDRNTGKGAMAELSQISFYENDQVVILSGPLKDVTGLIKKINLHKRTAEIEVEMMGRKMPVYLGIELLGK